MQHWLVKSEPDAFSWDDLVARGAAGEEWSGVRNYSARNHMRAMALGDLAFFYYTQDVRAIVGICEVSATVHPDSTSDDPRWDCVDMRALRPLPRPVTLAACKAEPRLQAMALIRMPRLSVQPVAPEEWQIICAMAGLAP